MPLVSASPTPEGPAFIRVIGDTAPMGYLNEAMGVAVSLAEDGRIYVADTGNARVHVFSTEGQPIGTWGKRGTGPGRFWHPTDVAVSRNGRYVYVVDQVQALIQRFEPRPECFDGTDSGCFGSDRVRYWGYRGFGDGAFQRPNGIAVDDNGDVYVSDAVTNNIQVFDAEGSHLRTFGGPGTDLGDLSWPGGVAIDPDGNVVVADRENHRLAYFTSKGEAFYLFTAGGDLHRPTGVAVGPDGSYVVRDYDPSFGTPRLWKFDSEKRLLMQRTLSFEPPEHEYELQGAALMPSGAVVVTDPFDLEVSLYIAAEGSEDQVVALRGLTPRQFDRPSDVAIGDGFQVVADRGNRRVLVLDMEDRPLSLIGGVTDPDVEFGAVGSVAIGPRREGGSQPIYITDPRRHMVYAYSSEGAQLAAWGIGQPAAKLEAFNNPEDIAVAPNGDVYVADTNNNRIVRRSPDGEILGVVGEEAGQLDYPMSVAYGPNGLIYVVEARKNRVQGFSPDGEQVLEWESDADPMDPQAGAFWLPVAVAADERFVYIMESDRRDHARVQVFDAEKEFPGNVFNVFAVGAGANPGKLWDPSDLVVTADGRILIADGGNNRVQLFAWPGADVPPTAIPTDTPVPSATPTHVPTRTRVPTEGPTDVPTAEPSPSPTDPGPTVDLPTNVAPTVEVQPTPTNEPVPTTVYLPFAIQGR